jgi:pyoverdine/dityrosine biosynthesis protein Dit1
MSDVLKKVKTNDINTLESGDTSKMKRDFLMTHYGRGIEDIRKDITHKDNLSTLYNCLSIFAKHDLVKKPEESKKAFKGRCKNVAINVMARSEAWAGLVKDAFPNAVRLSIHPYKDCSEKMPIKLLPSMDGRWRTPWHNTAIICDSPWPLHSMVKLAPLKWAKENDAVYMDEYLEDPMARVFMEKKLHNYTEVMKYAAF